jgi:hypothetical protein
MCAIKTTQTANNINNDYRINFNIMQLTNIKPIIEQESHIIVKNMIIIFAVVLALVVCGVILHYKRVIIRIKRYISNDVDLFEDS